MRHGKRRTRFGRQQSHRKATLKALARSVLWHDRIKTTHTMAREARRFVDKIITVAKVDSLAARKRAYAILGDRDLVVKLFKEIVPLFAKRNGGYTRIIPFDFRKGDGASMVFLELTEKKSRELPKKPQAKDKAAKTAAKPKAQKSQTPPKAASEVPLKEKEERAVEDVKKEKVKRERRKVEKQKGFFKQVKGFFRRKTNM